MMFLAVAACGSAVGDDAAQFDVNHADGAQSADAALKAEAKKLDGTWDDGKGGSLVLHGDTLTFELAQKGAESVKGDYAVTKDGELEITVKASANNRIVVYTTRYPYARKDSTLVWPALKPALRAQEQRTTVNGLWKTTATVVQVIDGWATTTIAEQGYDFQGTDEIGNTVEMPNTFGAGSKLPYKKTGPGAYSFDKNGQSSTLALITQTGKPSVLGLSFRKK
jgi:hypothetical protein